MSFTVKKTKLALRREGTPYEALAPGLYEDETVVSLGGGVSVAVSVERHWLQNGAGIGFHAYARLIERDGQTQTVRTKDDPEAHVEASLPFTADPLLIKTYTPDAIAAELALIVLGEKQKLKDDDGNLAIALSEEVMLNASIREQLKAVEATKSTFIGIAS